MKPSAPWQSNNVQTFDPMRRKIIAAGSFAVATTGLISSKRTSAQDFGIEGQEAPEISLDYWIDGDGKNSEFSVRKARGKWVFLKFFQNWCPGCHSSGFPTLKAFCDAFYGHPKVEIAAVQTVFEGFKTNDQAAVRELQLRYDIPATMGHDAGDQEARIPALTMINYRTRGTPWLVLINPDGIVVYNNFHVDKQKLIEYVKGAVA